MSQYDFDSAQVCEETTILFLQLKVKKRHLEIDVTNAHLYHPFTDFPNGNTHSAITESSDMSYSAYALHPFHSRQESSPLVVSAGRYSYMSGELQLSKALRFYHLKKPKINSQKYSYVSVSLLPN